jgi:hypothetical protein
MTKDDLIQQFPWTNIPLLFEASPNISSQFTEEQWRAINASGIPEALIRGVLNSLMLPVLLETLHTGSTYPEILMLINSGLISFKQLAINALEAALLQKMTAEELLQIFPWVVHPIVRTYAERFTLNQWAHMDNAGVPAFLSSNTLDELLIPGFFEAIYLVAMNPQVAANIQSGAYSFTQVVKEQVQMATQLAQQQSLVRPQAVIDWLGPELTRMFERQVASYA